MISEVEGDLLDMEQANPIEILLVEDNEGDVDLTRDALCRSSIPSKLCVISDGEQVLPFLRREGRFEAAPVPDLILLDLNLPGKDGREVLVDIKTDPDLRRIPIVIMTSSEADEDVLNSYLSYANSYVPKPVDLNQFRRAVALIQEYWTMARLPPRPS